MELPDVVQPLTQEVRAPMRTGYFERLIVEAPRRRRDPKANRSRAFVVIAVLLSTVIGFFLWLRINS